MDINNINNINNFNDFKIADNKLKNKPQQFPINQIQNTNENNFQLTDIINTTINTENSIKNQINENETQNKNLNNTNDQKDINLEEVPKNLTLFEVENESKFINKTTKNNVIRSFGPTNLPNNPEEMFINPKYL